MTARRPRAANRSSTSSSSPSSSSPSSSLPEPAARAAVLLAASAGMYALRAKRGRASAEGDDDDASGRSGDTPLASGKRPAAGGRASSKAAKSGGESMAAGQKKGMKARAAAPVNKTTGKLAVKKTPVTPAKVDEDSDSSLTSLSDLERDSPSAASSPRVLVTSPLEGSDEEDDGSFYVDDEDGDRNFSPAHPGRGSPSTAPARKKARKSLPSKNSASALKPPPVAAKGAVSPPVTAASTAAWRRSSLHLPPGVVRCSTDFKPLPMPTIVELYERRTNVLEDATCEATKDADLQVRSEEAIESAAEALQTGAQQTTLCLVMNRYTAFCGDERVDIPVFPLTCAKIALFLARCTATPIASLLLSVFPQPETYPLPVADCLDPNLTADEGNRLTRELAKCWIDALAYAQMATLDIWAPVLQPVQVASSSSNNEDGTGLTGAVHPSLRSLHDDRAIREILGALEPAEHMHNYEERMRARKAASSGVHGAPASWTHEQDIKGKGRAVDQDGDGAVGTVSGMGKTTWLKGGKAVAPPNPLVRASSSSSGGSQVHPRHSASGTTAISPEMDGGRPPMMNGWAASSDAPFPRINAFAPTDVDMSSSWREPSFAGQFSHEPAFAGTGTTAFPLPSLAVTAFAASSGSPSRLPSPSLSGSFRLPALRPPPAADAIHAAPNLSPPLARYPATSHSTLGQYQPVYEPLSFPLPAEQYQAQTHLPYPFSNSGHPDSSCTFITSMPPDSYGTFPAPPPLPSRQTGSQYVLINGVPYRIDPAPSAASSSFGALHTHPLESGVGNVVGASMQMRALPRWSGGAADQHPRVPPNRMPPHPHSAALSHVLQEADYAPSRLLSGGSEYGASNDQQCFPFTPAMCTRSRSILEPPAASYAGASRTSSGRFAPFDNHQHPAYDLPPPPRYALPDPDPDDWRASLPDQTPAPPPTGTSSAPVPTTAPSNAYPTPASPSTLAYGGEFAGAAVAAGAAPSLAGGAGGLEALHLGAMLAGVVVPAASATGLGIVLN
ncbi:hypothetical protein JCM3770_002429 [Rhodotorula araucariae]